MIDKLNAFLGRFVGPNAAHMIDGLIGVSLVAAGMFAYSAPARVFLLHHALLGVVASAAIPPMISLASKFRKAAGATNQVLADQIAAAVAKSLADAQAPQNADGKPALPIR